MRQLEKQKLNLEPWTSAMEEASRRTMSGIFNVTKKSGFTMDMKVCWCFGVKCVCSIYASPILSFEWSCMHLPHLGLLNVVDLFVCGSVGWLIASLIFFLLADSLINLLLSQQLSCPQETLVVLLQTILPARFQFPGSSLPSSSSCTASNILQYSLIFPWPARLCLRLRLCLSGVWPYEWSLPFFQAVCN